jgi:N-acetylglutamate synthase-like GNAT family acetyltransferase
MTDFTIRAAQETDLAAIKDLVYSSEINPMGLDWRRFVVAVNEQEEIIGCGQIKPHGKDVLELASIAVRPECRRQGIARAIIERLLADGPRPLYLMCRTRLQPLYEKFGFRAIRFEEMPRYFQRISRLAGWVDMVAQFGEGEGLSVMKLQ